MPASRKKCVVPVSNFPIRELFLFLTAIQHLRNAFFLLQKITRKHLRLLGFTTILDVVFTISLIPMKQNLKPGSLILLFIFLSAVACKKTIVDPPVTNTPPNTNTVPPVQPDSTKPVVTAQVPYPVEPVSECNYAPFYGDSIVYPQPATSSDFYVFEQNNQGMNGTYLSWPAGLAINPQTGAIDLTKSETGQRYSVAFVKEGTADTCMAPLIVAGASYMDSVYVLSQGETQSHPYFNANPYAPSPCPGSSGGQGCVFDYNNSAKNQGIAIDQHTGIIDLQQTMKQSLFGLLPINGMSVTTTIYYKLNDNSNNAAQKIQLKMMFYNRKSDIPGNVLTQITGSLLNTLGNLLLSKGPSPRPPLIIIVRNN
jgi:hypothetical protein